MQLCKMLIDAYIAKIKELYQLEPEAERPAIVKEGRLQDDPTKPVFSIMVSPNDYENDKWADVPVSRNDDALDRYQMKVYAYEIGGGQAWWRRFKIEWQIFGIKPGYTADRSLELATQAKSRIEMAVSKLSLKGMVDEFGEAALISLPVQSNMFRSGGEKANAIIWRGKVMTQALTERPW
jgi:hypothetical protein